MRPTAEDFASLLARLAPGYEPYYVIVCDGSGTVASKPFGWAAAVYEPPTGELVTLTGGGSNGTNSVAELTPFVMALWYCRRELELSAPARVLCVSDSEYVVRAGRGEYSRDALAELWASVEWFERNGVNFHWAWVPRNSNPVNAWADATAGDTRLVMVDRTAEVRDGGES